MSFSWVRSARSGAVRTLTLTGPTGAFRMNEESTAQFRSAVESAVADDSVRVLVVGGEASGWNVGGDLARMRDAGAAVDEVVRDIGVSLTPLVEALHGSDLITIAAVRGAVAGGGLGVLAAFDVVVAAEDAVLTQGYARLGANPDAGTTWFLPRMLGYRTALELYLTSQRLSAARAYDLGLVTTLVSSDAVNETASELAQRISRLEPKALVATKRMFRTAFDVPLRERMDDEIARFARSSTTATFGEGLSAFFDRRDPIFP